MRLILLCLVLLPIGLYAGTGVERNMLAGTWNKDFLAQHLAIEKVKEMFPAYENREQWQAIDPVYKKKMIEEGEAQLEFKWQVVPAMSYLEFVKSGNRRVMEDVYNMNLTAIKKLAFAELVEGKGRFMPQIINGVWTVCEITSWSISASLNLQKKGAGLPDVKEPVIELGAGITSNVLVWTYHIFHKAFDKYSPLIAQRLKAEIDRRILQPYYQRNDFWWMALNGKPGLVNNWNVWLNYEVLLSILLVEDDSAKRIEGVYKTMRSVDKFINYYKEDGGCEEGPAYWSHAGGMLYNYLSLLQQATSGTINIFDRPLIKNIGTYICKAYIDSNYFLNYADASAKLTADAGLIYHFGKSVNDSTMMAFGSYLAHEQQWEAIVPLETMTGGLRNLFSAAEMLAVKGSRPFLKSVWLEGTGIAVARDQAGSAKGFYFSALAGHNDESHNHNDVGTCVVFYDGQPLLIDIGSETYTRQTFGPERYTIWTMRSAYHNVPLINGVEQKEGAKYTSRNVSFTDTKSTATFSLDIAKAYPENAAVQQWQRSYQLNRGKSFVITDKYKLSAVTGSTELHFMTSAAVQQTKEGVLQLAAGNVNIDLEYNAKLFEPVIEPITITDSRLLQSWPPVVSRIILKLRSPVTEGSYNIILYPRQASSSAGIKH
ncbi:MAG: heparinase II/III family protein [Chitinophagaceae bacterium]